MMVTTTGMGTEMGSIATLLNQTESDKTPSETARQADDHHRRHGRHRLYHHDRPGDDRRTPLDSVFIAGIALAISAIPTGLPTVVTTMYSMGTRTCCTGRHRQAATLGGDAGLGLGHLFDKTGTLTLNKMTGG